MKRGVDENNKGPMFPRLHVNDTEKGGPRAPPRNKMALYEQLSIPSQRQNPHPTSSSQGRGSFFPIHQTPSDKINNRYSDMNNQHVQQDQKKKQENDDFRVPIMNQQSGMNIDCNHNHQNKDNEGLSPLISSFSSRFTNLQRNNSQDLPKSALNQSSKQNSHEVDNNNSVLNDVVNGDDVSENSMVDSVSGADISPDDVVGVIGQKHFWKARRAIVNQQRLFGVQVFELHRLIKVQKLIAGLPQPIIEDETFLQKPQKVSPIPIPIKKIPIPLLDLPKVKDFNEKSKDDTREEFSAENGGYEKASFSSVQNSTGPGPMFSGYPSDPRMGLWGPGHQWLIPYMSASEGLIYKPCYPGPGPGPPGSSPMFVNHGVPPPSHPHHQWPTGFPSMVPPPAHGYFPPYNMTPPTNNTSNGEDIRYKSVHASNNSEVQVSTASSLSENRDVLPLFPTCPPSEGGVDVGPSRVIRVVPRNAQLANESVARIFQSIQDERKRQDPV